jgi:hypothetical protein
VHRVHDKAGHPTDEIYEVPVEIDFQALTPGRHWKAATPEAVVDGIILGHWFSAGDHIERLCSVTSGQVEGREHVAYRVHVRRGDGDYLVEQQA